MKYIFRVLGLFFSFPFMFSVSIYWILSTPIKMMLGYILHYDAYHYAKKISINDMGYQINVYSFFPDIDPFILWFQDKCKNDK